MVARRARDRFETLLETAAGVFIASGGYRRAQMADVAEALGVSVGTLYRYVEGKEALFDLVVRWADGGIEAARPASLPAPTPAPGATLEYVARRLVEAAPLEVLDRALKRRGVGDVAGEFREIVATLYDRQAANRVAIKLIDRCAPDDPALGDLWFKGVRRVLVDGLARYLASPARARALRPIRDPAISARFVVEAISTFAVHRHWDPAPQPMDEGAARAAVVDHLAAAFLKEGADR